MSNGAEEPPGKPGAPPTWTSSAKTGMGTSLNPANAIWFTLGRGILTEVYCPRVDRAGIKELGFLVADAGAFFSDEKHDTRSEIRYLAPGVPAYRLTNTCKEGRYRLEKIILTDPHREVILQHVRFTPLKGNLEDYGLYALLTPRLNNQGHNNTGWVGDYKGVPMLFAQNGDRALALACTAPWGGRSVGYVASSDGWQDISEHKRLTHTYERAESGNIALTGQVDLAACQGEFVLALGFGEDASEAGHRVRASLLAGFKAVRDAYVRPWQAWQKTLVRIKGAKRHPKDIYRVSAAVMRCHEAKDFPGGIIASLSVPWGFARTEDDPGGYHVVWPRDLVESVGGLLAAGAHVDARRVLAYLQVTQEADGRWFQNMWLDGTAYWSGIQLDEVALAVLFLGLAHREKALKRADLPFFWPMVKKAAGYLVRNGPVTPMDRWEENPGYSPFTLGAVIGALLIAADLAEANHDKPLAGYLRETADAWNASLERWLYVTDTELARKVGVEGYYIRLAPPGAAGAESVAGLDVLVKNQPPKQSSIRAGDLVSPDALALVRFGLRAADDPRIVNTVRVIDAVLKVDAPQGPVWHRYTRDGYGEHADGSPYDGTGVGRAWPLLTGERAHFELAAGRRAEAESLLRAMEGFANESGLLPEQVWDAQDIPPRQLYFGKPTGSAMPLVWAHAEYVKLRRSLHDGKVFDTPPQTVRRYLKDRVGSPRAFWRFNHQVRSFRAGLVLRVEVLAPARVHWSVDGWETRRDTPTRDTGVGVYYADLPTAKLPAGTQFVFTFFWPDADHWEGKDFQVTVEEK
jgi:glucoamylase